MVALSEDEALLSQLFQYRFVSGRGLKGHSFGNLFLTALNSLTGDFGKAVRLSSEVLASNGQIFPVTARQRDTRSRTRHGPAGVGRKPYQQEPVTNPPRCVFGRPIAGPSKRRSRPSRTRT